MSCAGTYNFCFKKGFQINLNWKDSTGAVVSLTGYTAKLTLRNRVNSPNRFSVDLTSASGKIVLGGPVYNVVVTALPADTLAALPDLYDYDLELTAAGVVTTLLSGVATKEYSAVVP